MVTCREGSELLKLVPSKAIGLNWDVYNGFSAGENPYPDGYQLLPKERIGNVQVKGRSLLDEERRLNWGTIMS